jgi:hypothetical protein
MAEVSTSLVGGVVETEGVGTPAGGVVATSGLWPNTGTPDDVTQYAIKKRLRSAILKQLFASSLYT